MVYQPLTSLDPTKTRNASDTLCCLFDIPSLRDFQVQAGQNILRGRDTFLDIPTGGGKTLAFYYPLFYHWQPGKLEHDSLKITLVIGPLSGLLESQADVLNKKGVPAIALTGETEKLMDALKDFGNGKYRVGFIGPEMALSRDFHEMVLESRVFQDSIISVVVDEGHNVSEWGTDDFRPAFAKIQALPGRLPSELPTLVVSATIPPEVIADIQDKLGMGNGCDIIAVSNEKPNVALSVRVMQHPQDTFADLLSLFPLDLTSSDGFPQTLIYVNSRQDAERIQDFLRQYCPDCVPKTSFEFYHRFIADDRKKFVEKGLHDESLRAVPATDALGMGLDFRSVKRVVLWNEPRTFN
ncbi:P-loop containing nucleoside triphosphate hydrolase protein [Dendrothele bispora CBS 962.96]|uniref:DNA 3'-5' helicase n=1 Tax=Dendrothele bispora (strain CBS 962.96) TaxID=1314807 RepID=A0A4S8LEA2_DENBC|nr:P-loop containing nucleoside triphosphate hydrolase protein [Dendrothele bispora CBS 962.96]